MLVCFAAWRGKGARWCFYSTLVSSVRTPLPDGARHVPLWILFFNAGGPTSRGCSCFPLELRGKVLSLHADPEETLFEVHIHISDKGWGQDWWHTSGGGASVARRFPVKVLENAGGLVCHSASFWFAHSVCQKGQLLSPEPCIKTCQ